MRAHKPARSGIRPRQGGGLGGAGATSVGAGPAPNEGPPGNRQVPFGHFGEPADIAFLVACLCSPKVRYITGERIHVDGGYRRAY
jgi:NAD(P)-dependent dehydrogenase (short-subunit alcohol dehydrogenase family)